MSFINGSPLAGMGTTPAFEYERPQNETLQNASYAASPYGDGFARTPIALPIEGPTQNPGAFEGGSAYGTAPTGSSSENAFFASIMNSLSNLMQQISSYFGGSSATGSGGATQTQAPENFFSNATASSWGDPHDTFNGTTSQGGNVSDSWDSMQGHADLLHSDSFHGGYQISTTTTAPNASGVTYNASATVTTHDGNSAVTLNKDGSYSVTSAGQNVALTQGQTTQIGHGETVTLNADKSLTIVDTNRQGGAITTTLSDNGNGVDVKASASNVDLGGYLVTKSDRDADPVAYEQSSPGGYGYGYGYANGTPGVAYAGNTNPYDPTTGLPYGSETEPLGAGELEFA
jgi:hypothetical protein